MGRPLTRCCLRNLTIARPAGSPLPLWERDRVRGLARQREATFRSEIIGACRRQAPHPIPLPQGERGLCWSALRIRWGRWLDPLAACMEECAAGKGRAVAQSIRENMTDHQLLAGKRALVTGGGAGIGAAIVRALAKAGARVCVTDMNAEAAEELAAGLAGASPGMGGHLALRLDVTNAAETERVFDAAIAAFGGLDIVCANAGISTMNRVVDLTEAEWDANMDVNAKGIFLSNRAAVRRWQQAGAKGVIVNTASMAGKTGAPLLAHYCASKFAVVGFTQSLAKEVGGNGIRVNCVCPGYVRTSMQDRELVWEASLRSMTAAKVLAEYVSLTPLGRIEEPEDVADVVVFLASDLARFMTGEAVCVTGGAWMD